MENREFKIESRDNEFRVKKIDTIELMAVVMTLDLNSIESSKEYITFALDHIQVKIANDWISVKPKNKPVYWPANIENDYAAIKELISWFTTNIIKPVFQSSSKSNKDAE